MDRIEKKDIDAARLKHPSFKKSTKLLPAAFKYIIHLINMLTITDAKLQTKQPEAVEIAQGY